MLPQMTFCGSTNLQNRFQREAAGGKLDDGDGKSPWFVPNFFLFPKAPNALDAVGTVRCCSGESGLRLDSIADISF